MPGVTVTGCVSFSELDRKAKAFANGYRKAKQLIVVSPDHTAKLGDTGKCGLSKLSPSDGNQLTVAGDKTLDVAGSDKSVERRLNPGKGAPAIGEISHTANGGAQGDGVQTESLNRNS